jgi:hypothetical protein
MTICFLLFFGKGGGRVNHVIRIRNGLAVRSEEQAEKVPKIFPTNEIARNKICSADLLNGHEWRKVGCVVENKRIKKNISFNKNTVILAKLSKNKHE